MIKECTANMQILSRKKAKPSREILLKGLESNLDKFQSIKEISENEDISLPCAYKIV